MYKFSKRSLDNLYTCDYRIIAICNKVIKFRDFSVICGHRGQVAQDAAYRLGFTTKKWPDSNHNFEPSKAVDIIPCPFRGWSNLNDFRTLQNFVLGVAFTMEIPLRCGGIWNDFPHLELIE